MLSAEAIKAPLEAYDAAFEALWEDEHEAASLRRLRALLAGGAKERRPYQAPVSYRILPRVIGQFRRVIAEAENIAASSLRSVTDNPVFLQPSAEFPMGRVYSNGGYHNARAYPALDNLAAAAADHRDDFHLVAGVQEVIAVTGAGDNLLVHFHGHAAAIAAHLGQKSANGDFVRQLSLFPVQRDVHGIPLHESSNRSTRLASLIIRANRRARSLACR